MSIRIMKRFRHKCIVCGKTNWVLYKDMYFCKYCNADIYEKKRNQKRMDRDSEVDWKDKVRRILWMKRYSIQSIVRFVSIRSIVKSIWRTPLK